MNPVLPDWLLPVFHLGGLVYLTWFAPFRDEYGAWKWLLAAIWVLCVIWLLQALLGSQRRRTCEPGNEPVHEVAEVLADYVAGRGRTRTFHYLLDDRVVCSDQPMMSGGSSKEVMLLDLDPDFHSTSRFDLPATVGRAVLGLAATVAAAFAWGAEAPWRDYRVWIAVAAAALGLHVHFTFAGTPHAVTFLGRKRLTLLGRPDQAEDLARFARSVSRQIRICARRGEPQAR